VFTGIPAFAQIIQIRVNLARTGTRWRLRERGGADIRQDRSADELELTCDVVRGDTLFVQVFDLLIARQARGPTFLPSLDV
jgi:hypothetical protein